MLRIMSWERGADLRSQSAHIREKDCDPHCKNNNKFLCPLGQLQPVTIAELK